MCPIREILCKACGHIFDEIMKQGEPCPQCVQCESGNTEVLISAHGGIQGNFGTVPKRNQGSYKKAVRK